MIMQYANQVNSICRVDSALSFSRKVSFSYLIVAFFGGADLYS